MDDSIHAVVDIYQARIVETCSSLSLDLQSMRICTSEQCYWYLFIGPWLTSDLDSVVTCATYRQPLCGWAGGHNSHLRWEPQDQRYSGLLFGSAYTPFYSERNHPWVRNCSKLFRLNNSIIAVFSICGSYLSDSSIWTLRGAPSWVSTVPCPAIYCIEKS